MRRAIGIKKVIKKGKITDKNTDAEYWRSQPYAARIAALEEIRQEYHRVDMPMPKTIKIVRFKHDNP